MKQCPYCKAQIEDASRFCLYCMRPLEDKQVINVPRQKKAAWVIVVAIVLVLALAASILLLPKTKPDTEPTEPHKAEPSEPTEPTEPEKVWHSVAVSAAYLPDPAEGASYKLFHKSLEDIGSFSTDGRTNYNTLFASLQALYNTGEMLAIPAAYTNGSAYIHSAAKDSDGAFSFDGWMVQKNKVGDWCAIKFRTTDGGENCIGLEYYYHNANSAGVLNAYLLPTTTPEAEIAGLLTEEYQIGSIRVETDRESRQSYTDIFIENYPLEADCEYLLVVQIAEDLYEPENNRVDMLFSSLIVEKPD